MEYNTCSQTHTHTDHFNHRSPGKPGSASSPLDFQHPMNAISSSLMEQAKTIYTPATQSHHVFLWHPPAGFPQSPSSYIAWASMHHLYVQHVPTTFIYPHLRSPESLTSIFNAEKQCHITNYIWCHKQKYKNGNGNFQTCNCYSLTQLERSPYR